MGMKAEKLVSEALDLPPHIRAFVVEKLIESLDVAPEAELSAAWREEIRKRCREMEDGVVELRDAEVVFGKAYSALG
jgi:hypothetical protein